MNPTGNGISSTYLGNYGPSYASNYNIPNPWTMIHNPYYQGNPQLIFPNTCRLAAYFFPNVMSTGVVTTKEIKGVQACMMASQKTIPTSIFFTKNLLPYFQPPTQNPPLGFDNSRGEKPMRNSGSPSHGSGRPPKGGSGPLGRSGGPPSGGRPIGRGGGGFFIRSTSTFQCPLTKFPLKPMVPTMVSTTSTHYPFIKEIVTLPNLHYWDKSGCSCLSVSESHSG
jgi:hypothetical protein